jgi:hypothetical protein
MGSAPSHSPVELSSWQLLLQAFPLQGCWVGATTPAFSGWLVYLKFHDVFPLHPLRCSGSSALFATCLLLLLFIQFVFLLFSLDGGQYVQGPMLIWPRVVCGNTAWCLAHLVVCFSPASRSWHLVVQEPSWFLHLMWSGNAMSRLGVWRSQSFASSWWFFLQGVSPAFLQDFTLESTLSAFSL